MTFILWLILAVLSWPLALLALIAYPIVWSGSIAVVWLERGANTIGSNQECPPRSPPAERKAPS